MIGKRMNRIYAHVGLTPAIAVLACGLVAAPALAQSKPGSSSTPSSSQPAAPGTMGQDQSQMNQQAENDQDFLRKALDGGAAEVQLGQLAQQKSTSDDVKQFAQKMVDDHTQMDKQIEPLAKQMGVPGSKGPSKKDKQLMAKLETLSGPEFDQEYIKAMVKDHRQDLKEFKEEAQLTQNPYVKKAATEGSALISEHLQQIEQVAQAHSVTAEK